MGRLISAALDPVLLAAGFQAPHYSDGGEDAQRGTQFIFCAAHDQFSARHPRLPQADQQEPGGTCVDLIIDVRADGTLASFDLEGISIEETLRHVGLVTESRALATTRGRSLNEALPIVEAALRRLFGVAG